MFALVRSAITTLVFACRHLVEGKAPAREFITFDVDCVEHGKSFLARSRQTACCGSLQFVPSGKVTSRTCAPLPWRMRLREIRRTMRMTARMRRVSHAA